MIARMASQATKESPRVTDSCIVFRGHWKCERLCKLCFIQLMAYRLWGSVLIFFSAEGDRCDFWFHSYELFLLQIKLVEDKKDGAEGFK